MKWATFPWVCRAGCYACWKPERFAGWAGWRRADFRLIAATHRDLKGMVERGSFRRDFITGLACSRCTCWHCASGARTLPCWPKPCWPGWAPGRANRLSEAVKARLQTSDATIMPGIDAIVPLETVELRYLQWALAHHGGDRKSLAEQLGISERTLYRKLAM